jgi:hypothetical protein
VTTHSNGHAEYKVVLVGKARSIIQELHTELMQQGIGAIFLESLRKIYNYLREEPYEFGEALYRLHSLKLLVHQGVVSPLVVTYGVHDDLPLVFVHFVKVLSNPYQ